MIPTENQKQLLADIAKTIDFLQNTNDLHSPTHHSDLQERAKQLEEKYGVSATFLSIAFLDILSVVRCATKI